MCNAVIINNQSFSVTKILFKNRKIEKRFFLLFLEKVLEMSDDFPLTASN